MSGRAPGTGGRARARLGGGDLRAVFLGLAGLLLLYFLVPLVSFLPRVEAGALGSQLAAPALGRALGVTVGSASAATALAALMGVPLGYLLARDRVPGAGLVRALVLAPMVLPPVAAGVLLLNVLGPGGAVGRLLGSWGWSVADAFAGVVLAQLFVAAPFVVLSSEAAFRAVDPRLEEAAATLGRGEGATFRSVSLPLARYGVAAGLGLAWMRAAGEFGATMVLAYHPHSLPVYLWLELTARGVSAALPVVLVALALAGTVLAGVHVVARRARRQAEAAGPAVTDPELRGPARSEGAEPGPRAAAPPAAEGLPMELEEVRYRIGGFDLEVSLSVGPEVLSLFGPSGAGKTTLLRLIAGLERPDGGRVRIDGETVAGPGAWRPAHRRSVGIVFQGPSLFPHLTVRENVAFGLPRRMEGEEAAARVDRLLGWTRLGGLGARLPAELSGGQQQRVALARTLARRPRVLLLDEPFSSLDSNMRERLHEDVLRLQRSLGVAVVFVTHDLADACSLGDRLAVMAGGRIRQVGRPLEVLHRPTDYDVARFVGTRNLLDARVVERREGGARIRVGSLALQVDGPVPSGDAVVCCVRPEDLRVLPSGEGTADGESGAAAEAGVNRFAARVRSRRLRGATWILELELVDEPARVLRAEVPVRAPTAPAAGEGGAVDVLLPAAAPHLVAAPGAAADPSGGGRS